MQSGHRKRVLNKLRQKALISDYELLEAVLFFAIQRSDTKKVAKTLLLHFGSLQKILTAPYEELMAIHGIGERSAHLLTLLGQVYEFILHESLKERPVIASMDTLLEYCRLQMSHLPVEQVRVLFLNTQKKLLKNEVIHTGTYNSSVIYPRNIIKQALLIEATSMILIHNHPSLDVRPSHEDIHVTKHLAQAASMVKITLLDHIIIGANDFFSLKTAGLF